MWVYRSAAATKRRSLPTELGNWVDYWLFLTADETFPAWRLRPISLQSIAMLALNSEGHHNLALRRQLGVEVEALRPLVGHLSSIPNLPSVPALTNGAWHHDWIRWFKAIVARADRETVVGDII